MKQDIEEEKNDMMDEIREEEAQINSGGSGKEGVEEEDPGNESDDEIEKIIEDVAS